MSHFSSNYNDINRALGRLGEAFNVHHRIRGSKTIGEEIAELAAATVYERTVVQQLGPDLSPLARLRRKTVLRKVRLGFSLAIGVETGAMLDKDEIQGEVEIKDDTVTLEYGLDEHTRQKAEWFTDGRAKQEPRPFYELGKDGEKRMEDYIEEIDEQAHADFER